MLRRCRLRRLLVRRQVHYCPAPLSQFVSSSSSIPYSHHVSFATDRSFATDCRQSQLSISSLFGVLPRPSGCRSSAAPLPGSHHHWSFSKNTSNVSHYGRPSSNMALPNPDLEELKLDEPVPLTQHVETVVIPAPTEAETSSQPNGVADTKIETSEEWFIGSIDQGTTSSRFLIFNSEGIPVASHQIEFENMYPESGWHEHDPHELVSSVELCIEKAMEKFIELGHKKSDIKAVGITNQRETTICWDTNTGEPLYNAIVWPDTRTKDMVRELKERPGSDELLELCGLPLSTYPSSVKLLWLRANVEAVRLAYDERRLSFGTVDTWLIYRLNGGLAGGGPHVTDTTNASRTMFMNLRTLRYDDKLLSFFGLDRAHVALPRIVPSADAAAFGAICRGALAGTRITGCLGDQSSALVGQCGFSPGQAKNTYGTGCFLLYNVGEEPVVSRYGLLATVAYDFGAGRRPTYALEGSIAVAGSGVKFLVNNLGFIDHSRKITELAETVPDNGGVIFVTAFSGLFAPYWIDDAKGTLFGITAHTQRGHIARATLEATCYQTKAILESMAKDSGHRLESLAVDGGMTGSDLCMQTQADLLGIPVDRPAMRETTALGAAIAAGFAVGVWRELDELRRSVARRGGRAVFRPAIAAAKREAMFRMWEKAVRMCRGWTGENERVEHALERAEKEGHGERAVDPERMP